VAARNISLATTLKRRMTFAIELRLLQRISLLPRAGTQIERTTKKRLAEFGEKCPAFASQSWGCDRREIKLDLRRSPYYITFVNIRRIPIPRTIRDSSTEVVRAFGKNSKICRFLNFPGSPDSRWNRATRFLVAMGLRTFPKRIPRRIDQIFRLFGHQPHGRE
jgi:hypothetical protein